MQARDSSAQPEQLSRVVMKNLPLFDRSQSEMANGPSKKKHECRK
jgi:hypothetical protein